MTVCRLPCLLQLQGSKVKVSIAYPADISTPGYAKENLKKVCVPAERACRGLEQPALVVPCITSTHHAAADSGWRHWHLPVQV